MNTKRGSGEHEKESDPFIYALSPVVTGLKAEAPWKRWIAQTAFDCVDPNGKRFRVVARIGEPNMVPREGKYFPYGRCPVSLEPFASERRIGGEDTFQALCLALDFIRQVFKAFTAQGGKVLFPKTDTPIDLDNPSFCPFPDLRQFQPSKKRTTKRKNS